MKKKQDLPLYTGMWLIAICILFVLLWRNMGDARIINYSGLVRGATQKLVKEEMNGAPDNTLMERLDGVIFDLQTGEGDYDLAGSNDKKYQRQLAALQLVWADIKEEILQVRAGTAPPDALFALSQQHFQLADELVQCAEQNANRKLICFMLCYVFFLLLSVTVLAILHRRNQKELQRSIAADKLTGLLSRTGFEEQAAALLRRRPKAEFVIVEFDIDNFKVINDACGYAMGDKLLAGLAAAVSRWQGREFLCARINADDFVLLAEQTETLLRDLQAVLEGVVRELPFLEPFGGVTFTFGAYQIKHNGELIKTIMDKANTAHKTAKSLEHKSLVWYDEQLLEKLKQESKYKEQMHHGLANGEFKMYLQPKVDLTSMEVIGAEALVRWELPGSGIVPPDAYIPLFEKNGSIVELDFYMLEKACAYLREQLDAGAAPFTISVNFSRVTLYQQMFYEKFLNTVDRFALPHPCIEVEVTESAFNEIADAALNLLSSLKNAGFYISMDDFGAGYSNLNLLSKLPIQILKLDKELLRGIDRNQNMKGIVTCAVDMAHTMGIRVVCEGAERREHIAFLREIGCDYAQGYYFSKPIPQEEFLSAYRPTSAFLQQPAAPTPDLLAYPAGGRAGKPVLEEILAQTYPGFLSLRNAQHKIVYLNEHFKEWIARYTDADPLGKTDLELAAMMPDPVAETFRQCHDGSLALQKEPHNRAGLKKMIEWKGMTGTEEPARCFGVLKYWVKLLDTPYSFTVAYELTDLYQSNLQNWESSMTDSLTGAKNRRYLKANLDQFAGRYAAVFDLDHFKMVNDVEGHTVGDQVLRDFVSFLTENVPAMTTLVRLGGDEFLAVFREGETGAEIQSLLERARLLFEETNARYPDLSFSMGVDVVGRQEVETLHRLDQQMYQDKRRVKPRR